LGVPIDFFQQSPQTIEVQKKPKFEPFETNCYWQECHILTLNALPCEVFGLVGPNGGWKNQNVQGSHHLDGASLPSPPSTNRRCRAISAGAPAILLLIGEQ
jgi:hypothetical protein